MKKPRIAPRSGTGAGNRGASLASAAVLRKVPRCRSSLTHCRCHRSSRAKPICHRATSHLGTQNLRHPFAVASSSGTDRPRRPSGPEISGNNAEVGVPPQAARQAGRVQGNSGEVVARRRRGLDLHRVFLFLLVDERQCWIRLLLGG